MEQATAALPPAGAHAASAQPPAPGDAAFKRAAAFPPICCYFITRAALENGIKAVVDAKHTRAAQSVDREPGHAAHNLSHTLD